MTTTIGGTGRGIRPAKPRSPIGDGREVKTINPHASVDRGGSLDAYLALVRAFPLRPIQSDADLEAATAVLYALLDRPALDEAEEDYLDVLGDLIARYEAAHHAIAPATDAAMLAHLIEAKGTTQAEVARGTGIPESTISLVLSGRRRLSRANLGALARYLGVSPAVFAPG